MPGRDDHAFPTREIRRGDARHVGIAIEWIERHAQQALGETRQRHRQRMADARGVAFAQRAAPAVRPSPACRGLPSPHPRTARSIRVLRGSRCIGRCVTSGQATPSNCGTSGIDVILAERGLRRRGEGRRAGAPAPRDASRGRCGSWSKPRPRGRPTSPPSAMRARPASSPMRLGRAAVATSAAGTARGRRGWIASRSRSPVSARGEVVADLLRARAGVAAPSPTRARSAPSSVRLFAVHKRPEGGSTTRGATSLRQRPSRQAVPMSGSPIAGGRALRDRPEQAPADAAVRVGEHQVLGGESRRGR